MLSLRLDTLCEYAKATPSSRNMIEGQRVINSGMIIMCGASAKTKESIDLYALCLQTSALTKDPHTILGRLKITNISINDSDGEYSVSIDKMACSCKAGSSESCKHTVAVLLYCNRRDLNTLELLSSTDKKCLWKKHREPVLEQFEAHPTKTFCCVNQQRLPPLLLDAQDNIRNRLINCYSETALAKHRNRRMNNALPERVSRVPFMEIQNINRSVPDVNHNNNTVLKKKDYTDCVIKNAISSKEIIFLQDINFNLSDCCDSTYNSKIICNDVLQTAQSTKDCKSEWQKERKFRVTGSRCYALSTYSKGNWPEKARNYFWAKEFKTKYTRHGNEYESVARMTYTKEYNVVVQECGLVVCKSEPWMAYSPDGIVIKDNQAFKLLEIKCPFELENISTMVLAKKCKHFLKLEGGTLTLRKKHQYYGQIQFGMAILNLKDCDFVVYSSVSHSIKVFNISYDKQYVQNLLTTLKKVYFEKMLHVICENSRVT